VCFSALSLGERDVTFREIVEFLKKKTQRQDSTVDDYTYARSLGISRGHLREILTGAQPGSIKIVERALQAAGINVEDCLELPELRDRREGWFKRAETILKRDDEYAMLLASFIEFTEMHIQHKMRALESLFGKGVG